MRVRRARFRLVALAIGVVMTVLISGVGVPERLVQPASAAVPGSEPEPSVDGRAVPKPKDAKGAEDSAPVVKPKPPVWPKAGSAEVEVTSAPAKAGELPVRVANAGAGAGVGVDTVKV